MDGLRRLNGLPASEARSELLRCCASRRWAERMAAGRPYRDAGQLLAFAEDCWRGLPETDLLEAFAGHPRIGDKEALRSRFASTRDWASGEQAGAAGASEAALEALAAANRDYERRFGFIFVVCASGKSAAEMLGLLKARLENARDAELRVASEEQSKITRLRLEKLIQ